MRAPDWIQPGVKIGIVSHGRGAGSDIAVLATVQRVGPRDIVVVEDVRNIERRFSSKRLDEHGERDAWTPPAKLEHVESERFLRVWEEQRRRLSATRIERLVREWRQSGDDNLARTAHSELGYYLEVQ